MEMRHVTGALLLARNHAVAVTYTGMNVVGQGWVTDVRTGEARDLRSTRVQLTATNSMR